MSSGATPKGSDIQLQTPQKNCNRRPCPKWSHRSFPSSSPVLAFLDPARTSRLVSIRLFSSSRLDCICTFCCCWAPRRDSTDWRNCCANSVLMRLIWSRSWRAARADASRSSSCFVTISWCWVSWRTRSCWRPSSNAERRIPATENAAP